MASRASVISKRNQVTLLLKALNPDDPDWFKKAAMLLHELVPDAEEMLVHVSNLHHRFEQKTGAKDQEWEEWYSQMLVPSPQNSVLIENFYSRSDCDLASLTLREGEPGDVKVELTLPFPGRSSEIFTGRLSKAQSVFDFTHRSLEKDGLIVQRTIEYSAQGSCGPPPAYSPGAGTGSKEGLVHEH